MTSTSFRNVLVGSEKGDETRFLTCDYGKRKCMVAGWVVDSGLVVVFCFVGQREDNMELRYTLDRRSLQLVLTETCRGVPDCVFCTSSPGHVSVHGSVMRLVRALCNPIRQRD